MGQERIDNREVAKNMTAGEFEKWYKKEQVKQEQDWKDLDFSPIEKADFEAMKKKLREEKENM